VADRATRSVRRATIIKFFEDCAVGEDFESHSSYRITAQEINSFATKWDPQLYHLDEKEARRIVGQLFAPGTLTLCIGVRLTHDSGFYEISPVAGLGLAEVRMPVPVFVDDQLRVRVTIVSKRDSKSKPGLGVIISRHEVINQRGAVVLSFLLSALIYKKS
jgi:acyl dehydratase